MHRMTMQRAGKLRLSSPALAIPRLKWQHPWR